ncbi:uncharacterized protein LOC123673456 [Harmonia axyridis]|uniref:uncharacterized protein LOC123673456 n=1 Tax=Harmonia axyridis TaxID=115357 RepID=UPI001E27763E|nr:uncharacterized protein LOC123673456 [Harmonia axyridis]
MKWNSNVHQDSCRQVPVSQCPTLTVLSSLMLSGLNSQGPVFAYLQWGWTYSFPSGVRCVTYLLCSSLSVEIGVLDAQPVVLTSYVLLSEVMVDRWYFEEVLASC